ncbi:MAG: hypothetical protein U1E85_06755 [Rhodocyclaceae bacterium]
MRQKLDDLLCKNYPELFRDRHADMRTTAMCWGFDFDDGWFDLMDVLCAEIQRHATEKGLEVVAVQAKEKFRQLRFYVNGDDEFVAGLTWVASALSAGICEQCGKPAIVGGQGWISTRCLEHGGPNLSEIDFKKDSEQVFNLPAIKNPCWQRLAQVFEDVVENDIRRNGMPVIFVDEVIETDRLEFLWHGGDDKGRAAAFFRLVESYSARVRRQ